MTREELSARVRAIVADELAVPLADVALASDLIADLGADSLDAITLPFEIEQAFDLEIPEDDSDGFKTVANIVDYLARRLAESLAETAAAA